MPSYGFAIAFSIFMGFAGVAQAGLNRSIGLTWGLWAAVWLHSALFFLSASGVALVMMNRPELFPEILRFKSPGVGVSWWYVLPGFCGLCIVAGMPFAMSKIGSMNVFVIGVACQITGSLLWDRMVEQKPVTPYRMAGAVLATAGAVLAAFKRS
jgi:transporter family-2 protein